MNYKLNKLSLIQIRKISTIITILDIKDNSNKPAQKNTLYKILKALLICNKVTTVFKKNKSKRNQQVKFSTESKVLNN